MSPDDNGMNPIHLQHEDHDDDDSSVESGVDGRKEGNGGELVRLSVGKYPDADGIFLFFTLFGRKCLEWNYGINSRFFVYLEEARAQGFLVFPAAPSPFMTGEHVNLYNIIFVF
jgi:hypothetical protein